MNVTGPVRFSYTSARYGFNTLRVAEKRRSRHVLSMPRKRLGTIEEQQLMRFRFPLSIESNFQPIRKIKSGRKYQSSPMNPKLKNAVEGTRSCIFTILWSEAWTLPFLNHCTSNSRALFFVGPVFMHVEIDFTPLIRKNVIGVILTVITKLQELNLLLLAFWEKSPP